MCLYPVTISHKLTEEQKNKLLKKDPNIIFTRNGALEYYQVPCGKCIECERAKSNEWAYRCMLEAKLHEELSFITLTYKDECLPPGNNVSVHEAQKFIKRVRKHYPGRKIKYIMCGEYGSTENTFRPHYHAVVFGVDFEYDKVVQGITKAGKPYAQKVSSVLEKLWPFGFHSVDEVNLENIKYVAKYAQKQAFKSKVGYFDDVGLYKSKEVVDYGEKTRPFLVMSKGLGYDAWNGDIVTDKIYIDGYYIKTPRYYLDRFEKENACELEELREKRRTVAKLNSRTKAENEKYCENALKRLHKIKL